MLNRIRLICAISSDKLNLQLFQYHFLKSNQTHSDAQRDRERERERQTDRQTDRQIEQEPFGLQTSFVKKKIR